MATKGHDGFSEQLEDMKRKAQDDQALRGKKDPTIAVEREIRDDEGQSALLKRVGERVAPDATMTHVASFSAHIYKQKKSDGGGIVTLATGIENLPEALAQHMLKELTLHISRKYGRKPSGKRGEDLSYKNDSIVKPDKSKLAP